MAVFDPGRLYGRHEAPRAGRAARTIPLYAAVFGIGAMVVAGSAFVLDRPASGRSPAGIVQAPGVPAYRESQLGQPASPPATIPGGTLEFEVLGPEDFAPAVAVAAPAAVPVVEPPASAPAPSLAQSAPVAAPAQTAPVAPTAAPVTPAEPVAPPAATVPEPVAPPPAPAFYVPVVSGGPMTGLEQRFFDGMNAERAAAGLAPYVYDSGLSTIARTRSQQMVDQGYFGHRDPNGYSMYVELLAYFGYTSYAWAGENLAVNNYGDGESPERAIASLMNSPTHRSNILQSLFTRVGIGEVTHADGRKFYTMIFLG